MEESLIEILEIVKARFILSSTTSPFCGVSWMVIKCIARHNKGLFAIPLEVIITRDIRSNRDLCVEPGVLSQWYCQVVDFPQRREAIQKDKRKKVPIDVQLISGKIHEIWYIRAWHKYYMYSDILFYTLLAPSFSVVDYFNIFERYYTLTLRLKKKKKKRMLVKSKVQFAISICTVRIRILREHTVP